VGNDRPDKRPVAAPEPVSRGSERTLEPGSTADDTADDVVGPQLRHPERYRILGEHGRGGLGRVSRAHDRELGRDVAIKELISRSSVDEIRFLREALITARLEHPGIVPVHEAGRWPDGTPFYAMKLVSGRSLRDLIAERPGVDQRIGLLHHVIAVADAIAYAHGRHIIHRDLKPGNVIVGDFGETIVIDWGLAKDLTQSDESSARRTPLPDLRMLDEELTAAGSVLGTPAYMSPEQKRGEAVDQRADVFAIGAMLWELCSPRRTLISNPQQRERVLRRSGIDKDLIAIIDKALAADPDQRYRDAGALAADLKAFKAGTRIAGRSYSLLAVLGHWTRRHRALTLSVAAALAVAAAGVVLYVRNIAIERDRADSALVSAERERDRARLSEISLLLEKDPTKAKELLEALPVHSPRHAYLTSIARQLAATRVVPASGVITGLVRAPGSTTVEMLTRDGGLYRVDPATGVVETLDHDLTGAIAYRAGQWVYARRTFGSSSVRIASPSQSNVFDVDLTGLSRLVALDDAVYALDSKGDLHRLDGKTATVVDRGVSNVVGNGSIRITCKTAGDLDVVQNGQTIFHSRCPATKSPIGMAVVRDGYVAITDQRKLVATRAGHRLEIQTPIRGEYELAMSDTGVIAIADYDTNGTSFVRADGTKLEAGPVYASQLFGVAADGNLAAWAYSDGTVVVLDTGTGNVWKLRGHHTAVAYLTVDATSSRVVAAGNSELRIWDLKQPEISLVTTMPCVNHLIELSPTGKLAAADCNDGSVRVWSRDTGVVRLVHSHIGISFGIRWLDSQICSGGRQDGHVLCSNEDGSDLKVIDSGASEITWLTSNPDHTSLIFSSEDGRIWSYGKGLHGLYVHSGAFRLAVSDDGRYLASCARDGSLAVYDLVNHRLVAHVPSHGGPASEVVWRERDVWTAGDDGTLRQWALKDGTLSAGRTLHVPGSVRQLKPVSTGWVVIAGESIVGIQSDDTIAFRLDVGKTVSAMDASPDRKYVAAVSGGEIIVIDVRNRSIATIIVGIPEPRQLRFLDATSLAFSSVFAIKMAKIGHLDFVPLGPASSPELEPF